MSAVYTTSRYKLETIGQEADESTLLEFYKLDSLETSAWSDTLIAPTSPTTFAPNLPRKEEGMKDPLGIIVNNNDLVDDSDNASMLSYTESSINFSSTEFNPKKYLAIVHRDTPFQELIKGSERLKKDMGEKKGDLKSLVQSNFNAFVGAKNTVDELQQEMRSNSITEETEYSTQAYEKTLMDAIEQANIVFGPIIERTSRSEKIRTTLNIVERYKFFFNLPSSMLDYIKNSKYDLAVRDYKKGRHLMKSAASGTGSEGALRSLFDKVWVAVQISVGKVHESIFSKLDNPWAEIDIQTKHISYLLQLDSPNDPVVYFLQNQHKWVIEFVDRSFSEYVETLSGEGPAEEIGTEQSLLKRAKVLNLLQCTDKADSFVAAVEKQAFSGRWRATLTLIKILSEVIGKTIPELFRFIEQFHSNDQYNKKFDSSRTEGVWSQITEEIVALLAIAISKLFHAEPVSLPRRSDKSRHFNVIATLNQKKLPPFPVDVCCYVAGHYAGLMAQELSAAVAEAKAVALSKHARKLLTGVFSTFRTDIISIFCDAWVQDSRALFLSQDPQRAILPNLFQDHQQQCIGILQTLVQTTAAVLPDLRPESDPAILECAIPSLIQSTQAFLDGVNYNILIIHEPAEGKNDHLVAGLSCLQSIKERTRKLLADFETKLGLSKRLNLMEIKTSEKVLDGVFFDSLISAKFVSIRETIHYGILYSGFDWETSVTPKEIRPYIYEILMALVVVHAETIKMADHLVKRVLTTLAELIAQEFLICFRKLDQLSKEGALQATLEIEFIEQTLQPFNNFKVTSTFKSVYGSVQQGHHAMGQPPFQNIQDKELRDLEKLIAAARHTTRTQFACFTLRG